MPSDGFAGLERNTDMTRTTTRRPHTTRATRRGLSVLLLAALPAGLCQADAARAVDPFDDLDAIKLTIEIGGPLDMQGGTTRQLLADDLRRFNRFERALEMAATKKLESCGILVDPGTLDEISVGVYGRLEPRPQCTPQYVYMVEVKVLNTELVENPADAELIYFRPVIGLAEDQGLEAALTEAVVAILGDELRSCDRTGSR